MTTMKPGDLNEARQRLEATLCSTALCNKDSVYQMVIDQLSSSNDAGEQRISENDTVNDVAADLSGQLYDLLELLRSASGEMNRDIVVTMDEEALKGLWKLKYDTGQLRVMYREGPEGSPFHTLLAEGLIYSPITSALCLAWEAPSYKLWWPQMSMPTFKVLDSCWVKRGHKGGDLSFIRVKVPWPLAAREVLMHAFELEYFNEELIIVLLHSVPDLLEEGSCGHLDVPGVRMQLAGGFALQKVSAEQSYFRTVVNLDIKLDFVPPWLINFISRQLIGLGFKLYQKTLNSISKNESSSEHFKKLLETEARYTRVRAALQQRKGGQVHHKLRQKNDEAQKCSKDVQQESFDGGKLLYNEVTNSASSHMIVGDGDKGIEVDKRASESSTRVGEHFDPEVEAALMTLDKMISFVRTYRASGKASAHVQEDKLEKGPIHPSSLNRASPPDAVWDQLETKMASTLKSTPPRPEKVVPVTQVIDPAGQQSTKKEPLIVRKRFKLQDCFFCSYSRYFCCAARKA